jgi:peptidoglycan hydrolase CwlO-like protein
VRTRATHRTALTLRRALLFALALALAVGSTVPATAVAATATSTAGSSEAAQIAAMQTDFGTKVADYVAVTRELHRTEDDVAQVTSQIASGQAQVEAARSELATRAVELYRRPTFDLFTTILTAQSVSDLLARVDYLVMIADYDAQLIKNLRLSQTEEAWLQESLQMRATQLRKLQATADKQQVQLLKDLAAEQARAAALKATFTPGTDSTSTATPLKGSVPRNAFDRSTVVSQNNFRNGSAMTAADIQAFLARQPGALKSYRGTDHYGQAKSAAEMIADACVKFNINPKVILATLQKEQSLLTVKNPTQRQYNGAMGAGMPDSGSVAGNMQGFGNQVWWGAQKFDKNARDWSPGKTEPVDGNHQVCTNEGTFAQYRYTPHYGGVMSFWTIFWRYFGDPLS